MENKKYLMIHADDAGLAWSENLATQDGMINGSISSTSLMVPCPWFYEMAKFCLKNKNLDYGIHLTLTGEWKNYPFKPCSKKEEVYSLINKDGYFHPKRNHILLNADRDEVYIELKNQIDIAMSMGLNPSHLDSHMYTLGLREDLLEIYYKLGQEYKLPILLSKKLISYAGVDPNSLNLPSGKFIENVFMGSYDEFIGNGLHKFYDNILDNLPYGLSIILIHPAYDSEEMRQITVDHPNFGAKWRHDDINYFKSESCKKKLDDNNIKLVNWKSQEVINYLGA